MIPPLIFALGSSYSIHILNQYYYEAAASSNDNRWIVPAIFHITKTVIMASVTTAIGFGSLLFSTIERIREFGIFTSFGILLCAFLSLFIYPAVLSHLKAPRESHKKRISKGFLAFLIDTWANT